MKSTPSLDLRQEWADLLRRRPAFGRSLAVYGEILDGWARWTPRQVAPLECSADECGARWSRGVPLLAESPPRAAGDVESLLGPVMEALAGLGSEVAAALQRFADSWDRGEAGLDALLPAPGRLGSPEIERALDLPGGLLGFLAVGGLRPLLEVYFAGCRRHLDGPWTLGICPFCGAPPGWADLVEDGHRRLACQLCGAAWRSARLACPYCGSADTRDVVRLQAEGPDEGYAIAACARCKGCVKELDRRARWNAGSPLVEDWGSPHLDLVAGRQGYWRGVPTLVQLLVANP